MTLNYYRADERPFWEATVSVNGDTDDMSTGYTFLVTIAPTPTATPLTIKSTGITGGPDGVVTVAWQGSDLDLPEGTHLVQLTATRTSDDAEWTVQDRLRIRSRLV